MVEEKQEGVYFAPPPGKIGLNLLRRGWKVNVHEPSSWCIKSEFAHGEVNNPVKVYKGKDCVQKLCQHIVSDVKRLHRSFPEKPMEPLTSKQIKAHSEVKVCHICLEGFKIKDRKSETIVITLGNIEEPHIQTAICNLRYLVISP